MDRLRYLPLHPTVKGIQGLWHKKHSVGVGKDFAPLPSYPHRVSIWRFAHVLWETPKHLLHIKNSRRMGSRQTVQGRLMLWQQIEFVVASTMLFEKSTVWS